MRLLLQLALILSVCFIGDFLHRVCGIPLPGNILAMLVLFLLLCTKIVKVEQIEEMSNFFLKRLPFFFLPPTIGILAVYGVLKGSLLVFFLLCIFATIITMAVTGKITDILVNIQEKRKKDA
ncbi:MAG: CidA/LrgA family protein [Hallerella sp.]|jgi:holin-like protein|nr:CidA/LrgA family protein [Fibrobacter sp.]MDY6368820.1 CidA/LrgA family protein [Fibrobacter sp.]MDY6389345.1 CidA/LrgA family protein [Fibrobacter sp.]MEE3340906.1 CidA/LrgA family protein [Hallerella sp.]